MSSKFFTNKNGNTLIKEFEGLLQTNSSIKHLDAVVGFLRASGYFELRPFLDNINKVRILIGIDVDKYIAEAQKYGTLFQSVSEEAKEKCFDEFKQDIKHAHYSKQVEDGIMQMFEDIKSGKLELRMHPSKKIHAKIYILYPDNFNKHTLVAAITGSSNLTGNGLGTSPEKQYEFNVKLQDYDEVQFAKDEFEQLWEEAECCPITPKEMLEKVFNQTYLYKDATPYELYIKMLIEYFGEQILATDAYNPLDMPEGYTAYEYQKDAVIEGYTKLLKYDGFFLADVVGLGKTVVAAMIAKRFCIENGYENTKILVVYPPAVERNWRQTFKDFGIEKHADFVPNGSLHHVLDEENLKHGNPEDFDLVIVDESHKFRTNATNAFDKLQEICKTVRKNKGEIGGRKKVMLISATPMNNSPRDLFNQIKLFQDIRRCTIDGVTNLSKFFSPLIIEFDKKRQSKEYDEKTFKELAEKVRTRIIKPLTVRRTRTDIESVERYAKDVQGFPKVERPKGINYAMKPDIADLFQRTMQILDKGIQYTRYQTVFYLKPEISKRTYENPELFSRNLAAIRKNGLVKRLESSFFAFQESIKRFRKYNEKTIQMYEKGKVIISDDLDFGKMIQQGLDETEFEEMLNQIIEQKDAPTYKQEDFKPEYIELLRADQDLLEKMCAEWDKVTEADDSKFAQFYDKLKHEFFKKDLNKGQKLVIFSESAETVDYLARSINRKDVLMVNSGNRSNLAKTITENFDANIKPEKQKNEYNIIVTTDVLAEGVNLHRANIIVNYDTPWNATKLMQRIGRVNRIGSLSDKIYNYVFYPSQEGNAEIRLKQISLAKIQTFHTTYGEDNKIYSDEEILERDMDKLFDEGMQAERDERNEEIPFYEELRALYTNEPDEYERIKALSIRSRTGRAPKNIDGVQLSEDTLVFLKTNKRKCFYRASDASVEEISTLDAFKYFQADKEEKAIERIAQHHEHVNKIIEKFKADMRDEYNSEETQPDQNKAQGAKVKAAISLLTQLMRDIQEDHNRRKVSDLRDHIEHGTLESILKEVSKIDKDLKGQKLKRDEAISKVIELAKRHKKLEIIDKKTISPESDEEIILSESFAGEEC